MVDFGDRTVLEQRITAQRLVQIFDDDGDGIVAGTDLVALSEVMGAASDTVTGLLLNKGFSIEQLEFIKEDRQVIRAWQDIAAQLAGERKIEWLNDAGQGPFHAFGIRGRAELKALARGDIRSIKEAEAGINAAVSGEVDNRVFIFNADPNNPNDRYGPGGF